MKIARFSFSFLLFLATAAVSAQVNSRTTAIKIIKAGTFNVSALQDEWMSLVQHLEAPFPGTEAEEEYLDSLKEQISRQYENRKPAGQAQLRSSASDLTLLRNFKGANPGYSPNDNDIAISNDGMIVSVVNTTIQMYDINTSSTLKTISIDNFDPLAAGILFDAKVHYDPVDDRFIMVWLTGSVTSNYIDIAFSQTNDPTGTWNYYKINGDPYAKGSWSDYPMIAASKKEFFLTVNLVYGLSWQSGFKGTLIYEIDKQSGYSGDTAIHILRHDSVTYNNVLVRNICPVKGGSTTYGPNMYFLSNKNFDASNDTTYLLELTDTMGAPGQQLNITVLHASQSYFLAPTGRQKPSAMRLATNDSRILGAFYENGIIQYVQNTRDLSTGFAAVFHGIIYNVTENPYLISSVIGDPLRDFAYPNISYAGNSSSDNSAIISFNHTAPTAFAGLSAVKYDMNGAYSNVLKIVDGLSTVTKTDGFSSTIRWGDYTGSQRKYNEPGKVWASGYYAESGFNRCWIAELGIDLNTNVVVNSGESKTVLYPNPVTDLFSLSFTVKERQRMVFSLYDLKGVLVKEVYRHECNKGENIFQFSTSLLAKGTYLLKVENESGTAFTGKMVIKE